METSPWVTRRVGTKQALSCCVLCFALAHCGDSDPPNATAGAGGTGGTGGASGGAGGAADAGGTGGTGGVLPDSGGQGGNGGSINDGSTEASDVSLDARDGGRVSACVRGRAELSGNWAAAPWMQSYQIDRKFAAYQSGAAWQYFVHLETNGFLVLRGDGASPVRQGVARPVRTLLLTPASGPDPRSWYFSDVNSTVTGDTVDTRVDLNGLGKFGSCDSGVPVDGEVIVCHSASAGPCPQFKRSGTLDGVTVSEAEWIGTAGTSTTQGSLAFPDGMLIKYNHGGLSSPLTDGLVITTDGTIYCAGDASTYVKGVAPDVIETRTLKGFKRDASSAGTTGENTVKGCIGAE